MHAYRDLTPIDVQAMIREFCAKNNRRLAFEFLFSSTKILDMFATNVASQVITLLLLLTTTTTGYISLNIPLFLVQ